MFQRIKEFVIMIVGFLIALGVFSLIMPFIWELCTKNIYEAEILTIKDYYGIPTIEETIPSYYYYVKIHFEKPIYAAKVKIYPQKINIFSNKNETLPDEYNIVEGLSVKNTFFPYIQTTPRVLAIQKNEGKPSASTVSPDLVAKKIGEYKTAETFYDAKEGMLTVPFELNRGEELTKIFIFKGPTSLKPDYTSNTMGLPYGISGKSINLGPYPFHSYFYVGDINKLSPKDQMHIYLWEATKYIAENSFENTSKSLKKAALTVPESYLPKIIEGISLICQGDILIGNEMVKTHLKLINNNDLISILPYIIDCNLSIKPYNNSALEYYINFSIEKFPAYLRFYDFKAIFLLLNKKNKEALSIYESISHLLVASDKYSKIRFRKGIAHRQCEEYEISNKYLLDYIKYLEKDQNKINLEFVQFINFLIAKNNWDKGDQKNAITVLSNIDKTRLNGFSEKCNDCENNEIKWEIKNGKIIYMSEIFIPYSFMVE